MEEPLDLLLACHERIHRYLAGAEAVVAFPDWRDPRAITTAKGCARYFRDALPLHAQDEDLSVAPRLRQLDLGSETQAALRQMTQEHDAIHAGCAAVVDALEDIVAGGPRSDALETALAPFAALLRAHVDAEERLIFGHLERLSVEERRAIVGELRGRRRA
jgi:hypothetical protein